MATKQRSARPLTSKRPAAPAKPQAGKKAAVSPRRPTAKLASPPAAPKSSPARRPPAARAQPETLRLRAFSPGLTVGDLEKSIAFYTQALGFVVGERWMRDGQLTGVMLRAGACELGLSRDDWTRGRDRGKGEGFRLWAETRQDVDLLVTRARARGARITAEPEDKPWGVRAFSFDDPDGFHWTIFRELRG
jgi:uncharacterized glyoxalase superfamily protein PhnB